MLAGEPPGLYFVATDQNGQAHCFVVETTSHGLIFVYDGGVKMAPAAVIENFETVWVCHVAKTGDKMSVPSFESMDDVNVTFICRAPRALRVEGRCGKMQTD